jgi:two-component system cell cycle response regulator CpdR
MAIMKTSDTGVGATDDADERGLADVFDDGGFDDDGGLETLPDLRPARLLLAEEDDDLRRSIASRLRGRGYEVDEAFSGFEAIALIARQAAAYDLVISDLELYGMNGLELVDELRASPRSADTEVPVILLGDEPSGEAEREAQRLRAVIVTKPCDLEQLWRRAESLARPIQVDPRPN